MLRMPFRIRGRSASNLPAVARLICGIRRRVAIPVCYCNTYRRLFDTHGWQAKGNRAFAMDLGLANATAVVVGGGRGMGLATARCLADDGARVAVVGRTRDALDSAVTDLTGRGSPGCPRARRRHR